MFDFSLSELTVVMVVALIVIGPERLPKVARTLGHLYGRARRYVNGVKADISRDLAIEEFRQLQQKVQAEATALEVSARQLGQQVDQQVGQLNHAVSDAVNKSLPENPATPVMAAALNSDKPAVAIEQPRVPPAES
ncbi:MAG: Sec-independent protein translocase protein TatB [Gallionella sp.]|nr:Sec-independent protein translocase protein TatB [Gallionella sp.]MDD4945925.1 Sec-independent protein translocase protein TatB [Gallionella sp.]MDD5611419.1 Sec-independent protein translocase protein TatB [Gallionella sp.]